MGDESIERAEGMGALTIAALLKSDKHRGLEVFTDAEIKAVEKALFLRSGKETIKCFATDKPRQAKPEEIVRQLWIYRLMHRYKYPKHRIGIEFPITFGRDTSKRADIVIYDKDRPTVPYIIEVKAVKLKGVSNLFVA